VFLSPCPCAAAIRAIENAWENTEGRGDMFYEVWGLAGLPMGAEAAAGVERDQMADRQKAEIDNSAPFASVRAAVSMETAYRQAMHIPTTTLIFPPRLCWPPGSTCPIPQCREDSYIGE